MPGTCHILFLDFTDRGCLSGWFRCEVSFRAGICISDNGYLFFSLFFCYFFKFRKVLWPTTRLPLFRTYNVFTTLMTKNWKGKGFSEFPLKFLMRTTGTPNIIYFCFSSYFFSVMHLVYFKEKKQVEEVKRKSTVFDNFSI